MRIVLLGLLASTSLASADPATELPDLTAARKLIPETATCVPKSLSKKDAPDTSLQMGLVDGKPTLCVIGDGDKPPLGPLACWNVDTAKKKLVPIAPRLLPGETVRAELVKGCAYGLCLPKGEKPSPDSRYEVGINDAGDLAMLFTFNDTHEFATAYVFDRAKKTYLRKAEVNPGTSITKLVLVRDKVASMSVPAGPAAEFGIYETVASKKPKKTDDDGPADATSSVDIYEGDFWLVAPGELLLASAGFHHVERIDTATGKATELRKRKMSKCLQKERDDPGGNQKCSTKNEVGPYSGASIVAADGGYLAVLAGPKAGDIVTMTAKLAEKKLFNAYCTK